MNVDVVIIGYGIAGMTAAITAHDAGAEVVVLEKMPEDRAGGNSRVSGQVWFNPNDAEAAKVYLRSLSGEYPIPEDVLDVWARESTQHTAWVAERAREVEGRVPKDVGDPDGAGVGITSISFGDELKKMGAWEAPEFEFPEAEGNDCDPGFNYLGSNEGHSRLWLTLRTCLEDRGIEVLFEATAVELLRDGSRVAGVEVEGAGGTRTSITARAGVVVAAGGFANNQEMARSYLRLPFVTPWGSPGNTGDGIRLAQKVGADLDHPFNYMAMPGIRMPPFEAGEYVEPAGDRYVYVGADGRRFTDESVKTRHGKISIRGEYDFFPGVPMWTIFDEDARLAGPLAIPRSFYAVGWNKQVEGYEWSADNAAEIERGWIAKGETLAELAAELGIDAAGLEAEVERYNAACAAGSDPDHGRPAASLTPIERGPFYGYRWAQLLITTLGGIRKDARARALDPDGQAIEGLYVAGDVASTYSWGLSGGMGLADAMAFGRVAARDVVARVPEPRLTAGPAD